jgi:hypothetical protein
MLLSWEKDENDDEEGLPGGWFLRDLHSMGRALDDR